MTVGRADEAEVQVMQERLARADAAGTLELRRAYAVLAPLIRELPDTDSYLLGAVALEAWRVLQANEPEIYLAYRAAVRQRCGRHVVDLIDHLVGPPRKVLARAIELLSPEELETRPYPAWTISGLLPQRGIVVVVGAAGAGKSAFVLDVGLHVSLGERWRGRRVKQGGVVYVAAEGTMRARLAAFARHRNLQTLRGVPIRIVEQSIALHGADSDLSALLAKAASAAAEIGTIRLFVIDTLARTLVGNESDAADMGVYLASAASISETLGCAVMLVHHFGKDLSRGARGHSSLRAAADVEISLERDGNGHRFARLTKVRDAEDGAVFPFGLEVVDLGPHPDPDAGESERWSACVVVPSDEPITEDKPRRLAAGAQVALEALRTAIGLHGEPVPRTSVIPSGRKAVCGKRWQEAYSSLKPLPTDVQGDEVPRARNARRMALQRAQDQLQAARVVGTWNGLWWLS